MNDDEQQQEDVLVEEEEQTTAVPSNDETSTLVSVVHDNNNNDEQILPAHASSASSTPQQQEEEEARPSQRLSNSLRRNSTTIKLDNACLREDAIFQVLANPSLLDVDHLLSLEDEQVLESVCSVGLGISNLGKLLSELTLRCRTASTYANISPLLRGLRLGVAAKSRGPAKLFCHRGVGAGIEMSGLPALAKCFSNAWGMGAWIWLSAEAQPFTLLCFQTKEGFGVSVTVLPAEEKTTLLFESKEDARNKDGIQFATSAIKLRTWHYVYISHQRKQGGTLMLSIDDKLVLERNLAFPGATPATGGQQSPAVLGTIARATLLQDMFGLSGPVVVFNTAPSAQRISQLAKRQVSPIPAEGERFVVEEPAFATYSPETALGTLCLDLHGSHLGTLRAQTRVWVENPDKDILRALGGPLILLPFLQVRIAADSPALVSEYMLQSILLLASFVEAHAGNLTEFYECQGVKLLHHALDAMENGEVKREMLRESGRDLLSAISALTRACGMDTIGTSNEGGARLARITNWKPNSAEFELDLNFTLNLAFWVRFFAAAAPSNGNDEDEERLRVLLNRVVQFAAQRMGDRPVAVVRKRIGLRFLLDKIREMLHEGGNQVCCQRAASRFVDGVIAPLFAEQAITREEVRILLDFAIGSGFGVGSDAFRDRRRTFTWDEETIALSYCALRVLVRVFVHAHNHAALNSFPLTAILAVEVVAFGGIGERLRALALRVIGLSLATTTPANGGKDWKTGFSYISTALAFAVNKTQQRFVAAAAGNAPSTESSPRTRQQSSFSRQTAPPPVASSSSSSSTMHISHDIYNALLSMTITPCGSGSEGSKNAKWKQVCCSALSDGEGEEHLGADQFDLPVVVLDDAMKIANLDAIQVILDLLPYMSPLVQQRAFQDLYVLLKFDLSNRKSMGAIPQWQTSLGNFISTQNFAQDAHIVQMGMKIWVLILQDCVFRNEGEAVLEAYWLRASIGKQVSDLVLTSLFDSLLAQTQTMPPPLAWDALVKVAELAGLYKHCFQLLDVWSIPTPTASTAAMLIYSSTKSIDAHAADLLQATQAVRRIQKLLSAAQRNNALLVDAAIFAIAKTHAALAKLRRKFEFDVKEIGFLDACAMLLVVCAKYVAQAKTSAPMVNDLIELANAHSPNRDVFLRSKWCLYDLEPGFASLAQVTLEELSFSLNRAERDRFDQRFAKEKERLAALARARKELESATREQEERQVFAELSRLSSQQIALKNESRSIAERWLVLQREVALGATIWRDDTQFAHFCVSAREDHLRRRLFLNTNLDYESHEDAAYASTLSNNSSPLPSAASAAPSPRAGNGGGNNAAPAEESLGVAVFDKDEEILYVVESARLVTASYVIFGRVEVSAKHLIFYASQEQKQKQQQQARLTRARWRLDELLEIHSRRYLLRPIAIELFFLDRTTAFFAFGSSAIRDECSAHIIKQKPLRLEKAFTGALAPPAMVLKRSKLTEQWRKREMSNFEYLMKLNMIAGRTYNDLTQYFVFPWVLRDYNANELDLSKEDTFRDLTKPVGALNPEREREVRERYEVFAQESMDMPAFHHGSHYSSAGVVLHYLIRLEPFTTLAIELQSGRFDVPDRLFHSVPDSFQSCYSSVVDCRELIPEFFYCAEMFKNRDELKLGTRQDGARVDDVILPAWAKNDPNLFVRINREALESDYVSDNIHHWIDLIFGYKQRGKEAELACNVFSHLSYEGAVDLDAIEPIKRVAVEMQILEFGQCPSQLLLTPHPRRMSSAEWGRSVVVDLLREATYFRGADRQQQQQQRRRQQQQQQQRRWQLLVWRKQFWTAPPPPPLPAITPDTVVASALSLAPARTVKSLINLFSRGSSSNAPAPQPSNEAPPPPPPQALVPPPLVAITCFPDRAVLVHADFTASVVHLVEAGGGGSGTDAAQQLDMRLATQVVLPSAQQSSYLTTRPRDAGLVGTALGETLRGKAADFASTQGGNLLVSSAFFDGSLRCIRLDGTRLETNLTGHRSRVTCMAQDGRFLVSGDLSGALTLWKVGGSHDSREEMLEAFGETTAKFGSHEGPLLRIDRHLFGHMERITAIAVSSALGLVCTGSADGNMLVHSLEDGNNLANIRALPSRQAMQGESVDLIAISSGSGTIIAHSRQSYKLCAFSPNGKLLAETHLSERLNFIEVAQFHEQDVFVSGGDRSGEVFIRRAQDLALTRTVSFLKRYRGVRCCGVFPNGKYILIGCVDGSLIVLGDGTDVEPNAMNARLAADGNSSKQGMLLSE